jgi:hypothetical protein
MHLVSRLSCVTYATLKISKMGTLLRSRVIDIIKYKPVYNSKNTNV